MSTYSYTKCKHVDRNWNNGAVGELLEQQKPQFSFYQILLGAFLGQVRGRPGQLEAALKKMGDFGFLYKIFNDSCTKGNTQKTTHK